VISKAIPSQWTSEVLGVRVGTLNVEVIPPVKDIAFDNLGKFDVVFVKCDGWHDLDGVVALDHLYDMEQIVQRKGRRPYHKVSKVRISDERRLGIALTAFSESRFLRDDKISKRAPGIYRRWLAENEAYVLVNEPNDGFLVHDVDLDGSNRIALMAVAKENRGAGVGKRLVAGVLEKHGVWRVKVSARNLSAIRFYETMGFRMKNVLTAFHVWM